MNPAINPRMSHAMTDILTSGYQRKKRLLPHIGSRLATHAVKRADARAVALGRKPGWPRNHGHPPTLDALGKRPRMTTGGRARPSAPLARDVILRREEHEVFPQSFLQVFRCTELWAAARPVRLIAASASPR